APRNGLRAAAARPIGPGDPLRGRRPEVGRPAGPPHGPEARAAPADRAPRDFAHPVAGPRGAAALQPVVLLLAAVLGPAADRRDLPLHVRARGGSGEPVAGGRGGAHERARVHALLQEVHGEDVRRAPDRTSRGLGLPPARRNRSDGDGGLLRRRFQQRQHVQSSIPGAQGHDASGLPEPVHPLGSRIEADRMNYGMNMLLWTDDCTGAKFPPLFGRLRAMGYDTVELPILNVDARKLAALARTLDGLGLARTSATCLTPDRNLIGEDRRQRRAGVEHLKRVIDASRQIGSPLLIGPIYAALGVFSGKPPSAREWAWAVEGLREAGEHAASAGGTPARGYLNPFEVYPRNCAAG